MPRAIPLTISSRRTARSRDSISAIPDPYGVGCRVPTTAIAGLLSKLRIAAHPQHRRRIVDLLQPLRILRAAEAHHRRALRRHPRPLLLGRRPRLAVKDELRRLRRKPQPLQLRQRQRKNLARRLQLLHRIQNPLRPQPRRQRQRQPRQPLLIQPPNSVVRACEVPAFSVKSANLDIL